MTEAPAYINTRTFNAPPEKLWEAWTDPAIFAQWYGPGVETKIHSWNLELGGAWHGEMVMQPPMRMGGTFTDVTPNNSFAFTQASTDENWQAIDSPMMQGWPKFVRTHVTFKELGGDKTKQVMTWTPHEASDAECAVFASIKDRMGGGWDKGFDLLEEILAG